MVAGMTGRRAAQPRKERQRSEAAAKEDVNTTDEASLRISGLQAAG
jgi:hypothetical protein